MRTKNYTSSPWSQSCIAVVSVHLVRVRCGPITAVAMMQVEQRRGNCTGRCASQHATPSHAPRLFGTFPAAAQVCREAGARVTTNMLVREIGSRGRRTHTLARGSACHRHHPRIAVETDGTARNGQLTEILSRPADARRGPTPNSWVKEVGLPGKRPCPVGILHPPRPNSGSLASPLECNVRLQCRPCFCCVTSRPSPHARHW